MNNDRATVGLECKCGQIRGDWSSVLANYRLWNCRCATITLKRLYENCNMEVTAKPSVARDTFEQHGLKLVAAGSTSASPVTSQVRDMAIKTRNDTVVSLSCDCTSVAGPWSFVMTQNNANACRCASVNLKCIERGCDTKIVWAPDVAVSFFHQHCIQHYHSVSNRTPAQGSSSKAYSPQAGTSRASSPPRPPATGSPSPQTTPSRRPSPQGRQGLHGRRS